MPANQKLKNYITDIKERTFARADRFEVTFNLGEIKDESVGRFRDRKDPIKTAQLYCEEVQIPGMILSNKEFNLGPWTFFRNTKVGFLGNEINFTFLTTNDWELRSLFEEWISACADTNSQELGYIDDVTCTIDIATLDLKDQVTKRWRLYEAMPKVLNLVPMSSGTVAPIRNTLIVSAAYWESSDSKKGNGIESFGTSESNRSSIQNKWDVSRLEDIIEV
tara:strand:+ start:1229 stop:1891 length:663 start_codon:yes stop_codon:yes gene_type:complete